MANNQIDIDIWKNWVEKIDIEKIDIEILIAFEAITPSKGVTETTSLPTIWKSFINHSLADI